MDKHLNLMPEVCLCQVAANVEGIRAILERLLSQPAARAPGADATPVTLVNNLVRVMMSNAVATSAVHSFHIELVWELVCAMA